MLMISNTSSILCTDPDLSPVIGSSERRGSVRLCTALLALGALWVVLGWEVAAQARSGASVAPECEELSELAADAVPRRSLEVEGAAGVWMPVAVSRALLCEVKAGRAAQRQIRLLDQELELTIQQVEWTQRQLTVMADSRSAAMEAVEAAERQRRYAEDRLDAWHRSPILWFTLGSVATAIVFALSVRAIDSLRGS